METKHKLNIRDLVRSIHPHKYTNNFFFSNVHRRQIFVWKTEIHCSCNRLNFTVQYTLTQTFLSFISWFFWSILFFHLMQMCWTVSPIIINIYVFLRYLSSADDFFFLLLNPDMVINKSNNVAFRNQISQFTVKYITTIKSRKTSRKLVNNDIPKYREENQNSTER